MTDTNYAYLFSGEFSKEDLAATVVWNSMYHLAEFVIATAQTYGVKTVYFCGATISHPLAQKYLTGAFLVKTLMDPRPVGAGN